VLPRPHARQKPFRQYFYIDSEHHLIDNGIITTGRDTFNAVETAYVRDGRPFVCGLDGFTIDTAWGRATDGAYRAMQGMGDFQDQASAAIKDLF
jgi:hypothetical protein